MDTFVEQIVVKRKSIKDFAIIFFSIIAAFIVAAIIFLVALPFLGMIAFLLLAGMGYGLWWLLTSLNIEYEYSVTNGDIDIDQITAKRKRKRIVSVSGAKIESLEPFNQQEYVAKGSTGGYRRPSLEDPDLWCFLPK